MSAAGMSTTLTKADKGGGQIDKLNKGWGLKYSNFANIVYGQPLHATYTNLNAYISNIHKFNHISNIFLISPDSFSYIKSGDKQWLDLKNYIYLITIITSP